MHALSPATLLAHLGRHSADAGQNAEGAQPVNAALARASTITFSSLRAYKDAYRKTVFESPRYGRSGTATTFELQQAMATLAGAESCIATGSGLAAIVAVLSAHAGAGKHMLINEGVYGPTRAFAENELRAFGTDVEFFPAGADIGPLLRPSTSLLFLETPASLTMEMLDVRALAAAAHERGVPVAADASWGTPVFMDAHGLGIDIAIHSATKFINGHSDLLLGLLTGSYQALASSRAFCDRSGVHAAPDACWLTLRGLRTLAVRLQQHQSSALQIARWLQAQPQVVRVLFPALETDPGHALWRSQFSGAAGPFTLELAPCSEARFEALMDALQLFALGTSWGGFESLAMPALAQAQRAVPTQPDAGRLLRLHIGLEDADDLCRDLAQALQQL